MGIHRCHGCPINRHSVPLLFPNLHDLPQARENEFARSPRLMQPPGRIERATHVEATVNQTGREPRQSRESSAPVPRLQNVLYPGQRQSHCLLQVLRPCLHPIGGGCRICLCSEA